MRSFLLILAATVVLAACGAKVAVDTTGTTGTGGAGGNGTGTSNATSTVSGTGGGTPLPQQLAQVRATCAPDDGPAIGIFVNGVAGCMAPQQQPVPGLEVTIWEPLLGTLHPGAVVKLGGDFSSGANAVRVNVMTNGAVSVTPVTGGTLVLDTFVGGASATGTFDVIFGDGSTEQGAFNAVWCTGLAGCG